MQQAEIYFSLQEPKLLDALNGTLNVNFSFSDSSRLRYFASFELSALAAQKTRIAQTDAFRFQLVADSEASVSHNFLAWCQLPGTAQQNPRFE